MTMKKRLVGLCVIIITLAGILGLLLKDNSAVDKVAYRTGTSEVYLEDAKIASFCQFVEELESSPVIEGEKPGEILYGYYSYEIQYKNGTAKYIAVNAARLAIDGIAHKSSQEICNKLQNFFKMRSITETAIRLSNE